MQDFIKLPKDSLGRESVGKAAMVIWESNYMGDWSPGQNLTGIASKVDQYYRKGYKTIFSFCNKKI